MKKQETQERKKPTLEEVMGEGGTDGTHPTPNQSNQSESVRDARSNHSQGGMGRKEGRAASVPLLGEGGRGGGTECGPASCPAAGLPLPPLMRERLLYRISLPQLVRAADEVTTDEQL